MGAWSQHSTRKKGLKSPFIAQACWCYFQHTGWDALLCLLHTRSLTLCTLDGDVQTIPLPDEYSTLSPLPHGILLSVRVWSAFFCSSELVIKSALGKLVLLCCVVLNRLIVTDLSRVCHCRASPAHPRAC